MTRSKISLNLPHTLKFQFLFVFISCCLFVQGQPVPKATSTLQILSVDLQPSPSPQPECPAGSFPVIVDALNTPVNGEQIRYFSNSKPSMPNFLLNSTTAWNGSVSDWRLPLPSVMFSVISNVHPVIALPPATARNGNMSVPFYAVLPIGRQYMPIALYVPTVYGRGANFSANQNTYLSFAPQQGRIDPSVSLLSSLLDILPASTAQPRALVSFFIRANGTISPVVNSNAFLFGNGILYTPHFFASSYLNLSQAKVVNSPSFPYTLLPAQNETALESLFGAGLPRDIFGDIPYFCKSQVSGSTTSSSSRMSSVPFSPPGTPSVSMATPPLSPPGTPSGSIVRPPFSSPATPSVSSVRTSTSASQTTVSLFATPSLVAGFDCVPGTFPVVAGNDSWNRPLPGDQVRRSTFNVPMSGDDIPGFLDNSAMGSWDGLLRDWVHPIPPVLPSTDSQYRPVVVLPPPQAVPMMQPPLPYYVSIPIDRNFIPLALYVPVPLLPAANPGTGNPPPQNFLAFPLRMGRINPNASLVSSLLSYNWNDVRATEPMALVPFFMAANGSVIPFFGNRPPVNSTIPQLGSGVLYFPHFFSPSYDDLSRAKQMDAPRLPYTVLPRLNMTAMDLLYRAGLPRDIFISSYSFDVTYFCRNNSYVPPTQTPSTTNPSGPSQDPYLPYMMAQCPAGSTAAPIKAQNPARPGEEIRYFDSFYSPFQGFPNMGEWYKSYIGMIASSINQTRQMTIMQYDTLSRFYGNRSCVVKSEIDRAFPNSTFNNIVNVNASNCIPLNGVMDIKGLLDEFETSLSSLSPRMYHIPIFDNVNLASEWSGYVGEWTFPLPNITLPATQRYRPAVVTPPLAAFKTFFRPFYVVIPSGPYEIPVALYVPIVLGRVNASMYSNIPRTGKLRSFDPVEGGIRNEAMLLPRLLRPLGPAGVAEPLYLAAFHLSPSGVVTPFFGPRPQPGQQVPGLPDGVLYFPFFVVPSYAELSSALGRISMTFPYTELNEIDKATFDLLYSVGGLPTNGLGGNLRPFVCRGGPVATTTRVAVATPVIPTTTRVGVVVSVTFTTASPPVLAQTTVRPAFTAPANIVPSPAPTLVRAIFNGNAVQLDFDRAVSIVDLSGPQVRIVDNVVEFPCEAFIQTRVPGSAVFAREGFSFDCTATKVTLKTFMLRMKNVVADTENSVKPGDYVALKPNSVWSFNAKASEAAFGYVVISPPENIPIPSIAIRGPSRIDQCPDLGFEIIISGGSAGRAWTSVNLWFEASVSDASDSALQQRLDQFANIVKAGEASRFMIPKNMLVARSYVFRMNVTNFLGGSSSAVYNLEKLDVNNIPTVTIRAPQGALKIGDAVPIQGSVIASQCGAMIPVEFQWFVPFSVRNTRGSMLKIEPFTLEADMTYTITLQVNYVNSPQKYNFSTTITTMPETLTIISGSSIRVGVDNEFSVRPRVTSTSNNVNRALYNCTWTCVTADTQDPCSFNNEYTLPSVCGDITVPAGALSNASYYFTMSALNTRSLAITTGVPAMVEIVPEPVLAIAIYNSEPITATTSSKFFLQVRDLPAATNGRWRFTWTSEETCFGSSYAVVSITESNLLAPPTGSTLKFKPGVLVPNANYCFKVVAVNGAKTGSSVSTVTVLGAPTGGTCTLSSSNNTIRAFTDTVSVVCSGWETNEIAYPLKYQFQLGVIQNGVISEYRLVNPLGDSDSLSIVLPPGKYSILASVVDSYGSTANADPITVVSIMPTFAKRKRALSSGLVNLALNYLQTSFSTYNLTGNSAQSLSDIGIISNILLDNTGTPEGLQIQAYLLTYLQSLVNGDNLSVDDQVNGPFIASVMSVILGSQYTIPTNVLNSVTPLLTKVIRDAATSGEAASTCFSFTVASKLLGVIDILLGSIRNTKSTTLEQYVPSLQASASYIDGCLHRTMTCGQTDVSLVSGAYFNRTIGIQDASVETSFCGYSFNSTPPLLSSTGCVRFACGSVQQNVSYRTPIVAVVPLVQNISFSGSSGQSLNPSLANGNMISFNVTTSGLSNYNLTGSTHAPVCGTLLGGELTGSCQVSRVFIGSVTCSCTSTGNFAVGVKRLSTSNSDPDTPVIFTTPPAQSSVGAIVGGVIGGCVGASLVAATVIMRQKAARKKRQAKQEDKEESEKS